VCGGDAVADREEESPLFWWACALVYFGYLAAIAWLGLRGWS